jgi:hypothetical protein
VNGEASRRDDYDCHQRAQNPVCRGASALDTSQPTKLMSVTTMTPSQNLRYPICSFALSSFDTGKDQHFSQ